MNAKQQQLHAANWYFSHSQVLCLSRAHLPAAAPPPAHCVLSPVSQVYFQRLFLSWLLLLLFQLLLLLLLLCVPVRPLANEARSHYVYVISIIMHFVHIRNWLLLYLKIPHWTTWVRFKLKATMLQQFLLYLITI